jgi:hypothetical protein
MMLLHQDTHFYQMFLLVYTSLTIALALCLSKQQWLQTNNSAALVPHFQQPFKLAVCMAHAMAGSAVRLHLCTACLS